MTTTIFQELKNQNILTFHTQKYVCFESALKLALHFIVFSIFELPPSLFPFLQFCVIFARLFSIVLICSSSISRFLFEERGVLQRISQLSIKINSVRFSLQKSIYIMLQKSCSELLVDLEFLFLKFIFFIHSFIHVDLSLYKT